MAEEDLRVAAFIVNDWRHVYYAISERLKETPIAVADLAEAIATALTAARAETWKEAIAVVSRYGAAHRHAFGDTSIPSIMDSLEAAAGSSEAEDRKAAVIRRGKE